MKTSVGTYNIRENSDCNITIHFNHVSLFGSKWFINGLNLALNGSNLEETKFVLGNFGKKNEIKSIHISNSSFGQLKVVQGFSIALADCNIENITLHDTLIDVADCYLTITNSIFNLLRKTDSGSAILNAISSNVTLWNVTCSQNYATNGLIQIENRSELYVENSHFEKNGYKVLTSSVFLIKLNSFVSISNCTFVENVALRGSCLTVYFRTTVIITNSTFLYNAAVKGGSIYIDETGTTLYSKDSHLNGLDNELQNIFAKKSHNQIKNAKELNETQIGIGNSSNAETTKLIISHCDFINGTSPLTEGGVLYIIGSSMEIIFTQSNFILNDCGLGKCGVLCSWGIGDTMLRITIQDCYF